MYPSATMILAKQPIWSFPLHYACSRGGTICVDTLHYLCRVCFERPLLKGIFYSRNISFYRIDAFQRVIMFRFLFQTKEGIYTNNAPFAPYELHRETAIIKVGHWCYIRKLVECAKKDKMFNLVIHGIFVSCIYQTAKISAYHSSFLLVI